MNQRAVIRKNGAPVKVDGAAGNMEVPAVPGETFLHKEPTDQELNRKVLERMGERAQAIEVDIDDI